MTQIEVENSQENLLIEVVQEKLKPYLTKLNSEGEDLNISLIPPEEQISGKTNDEEKESSGMVVIELNRLRIDKKSLNSYYATVGKKASIGEMIADTNTKDFHPVNSIFHLRNFLDIDSIGRLHTLENIIFLNERGLKSSYKVHLDDNGYPEFLSFKLSGPNIKVPVTTHQERLADNNIREIAEILMENKILKIMLEAGINTGGEGKKGNRFWRGFSLDSWDKINLEVGLEADSEYFKKIGFPHLKLKEEKMNDGKVQYNISTGIFDKSTIDHSFFEKEKNATTRTTARSV